MWPLFSTPYSLRRKKNIRGKKCCLAKRRGQSFDPCWVNLSPCWVNLSPSWVNLSPSWVNLNPCWVNLNPSWVNLSPYFRDGIAELKPSLHIMEW